MSAICRAVRKSARERSTRNTGSCTCAPATAAASGTRVLERAADGRPDRLGDRGRERVADLPVARGLAAAEPPAPVVLPACNLVTISQVSRGDKAGSASSRAPGRRRRCRPRRARPRRAWCGSGQVGAAVLLGAADDRGRDAVGAAGRRRPGPATRGHQVASVSHGGAVELRQRTARNQLRATLEGDEDGRGRSCGTPKSMPAAAAAGTYELGQPVQDVLPVRADGWCSAP